MNAKQCFPNCFSICKVWNKNKINKDWTRNENEFIHIRVRLHIRNEERISFVLTTGTTIDKKIQSICIAIRRRMNPTGFVSKSIWLSNSFVFGRKYVNIGAMIKPITPPNVFKTNHRYQIIGMHNCIYRIIQSLVLARKIVKGKRKCKLFVRNYVGNNNVSKYRMEQLIEH